MSAVTQTFGTKTSLTVTLTSLGSGSARESNVLDLTSSLELDVLFRVKANGSAAGNTGTLEVYAYAALGDTGYSDGATGSDAAFTAANIQNAKFVDNIIMNGTTQVIAVLRSLRAAFGGTLPNKVGLIFYNNSGAALSATSGDFAVEYQTVKLSVA